jgi:hypothetical protein
VKKFLFPLALVAFGGAVAGAGVGYYHPLLYHWEWLWLLFVGGCFVCSGASLIPYAASLR